MTSAEAAKYLAFLLCMSISHSLLAGDVTLFRGQGADINLPDIIPKALKGDIKMDPTYFWGLNYRQSIPPGDNRFSHFLQAHRIIPEWEVQLTRHHGLQDNVESHAALLLRSRDFSPVDHLLVNFAAGMGPSYAFSTPTYEDGPDGQPNHGKYKFQSYITFEMAFTLRALPQWGLAARVHHRSGIYGLIAPSQVGSNFFAIGIRRRF